MKKLIATTVLALAATTGAVAAAPGAHADTPGCVSRAEFGAAKKGMKQAAVERRFDTKGKKSLQGFGMLVKDYKVCTDPQFGFASVTFERRAGVFRLVDKFAYWG